MRKPLQRADWLTHRRIRLISVITLVFSILTVTFIVATSSNLFDVTGNVVGSDYSAFWTAGQMALEGRASDAYNGSVQFEYLCMLFDNPDTPYSAWLHPPIFYLFTIPFAHLPYLLSLFCWVGLGLWAYVRMIRQIDGRAIALLVALAFPPVLINVIHGQTGLFYAALLGAALMSLKTRPWLAGVLIGLLACKPQLGLLIPFVLLAGGHFKSFTSAACTVLLLCAASAMIFGPEIWLAFLQGTEISRGQILEAGATGWHKIPSLFAITRLTGGSIAAAYAIHVAIALPIAVLTIWTWTRPVDARLKYAALLTASCLVTPYIYDYDYAILAPGLAWFILYVQPRGFLAYEKAGLGFAWLAPSITRNIAEYSHVSIGLLSVILVFGLIARRIWRETYSAEIPSRSAAMP